MKNKIGWCNLTFNPVWGCKNDCKYCYARGIAKRFADKIAIKESFYLLRNGLINQDKIEVILNVRKKIKENINNFKPTFLYSQFEKQFPKKSQKIFVGSMSEVAHWEKRWMEVILGRILCYPQHIFQFLTQYPDIYFGKYDFPMNCWLGTTITKPLDKGPMGYYTEKAFNLNKNNLKFISFEPLLERIEPKFKVDWVIIGAETGNRKGKVIPKKEWIEEIGNYCREENIPIYLKDSIYKLYPDWPVTKEFPEMEPIKCKE